MTFVSAIYKVRYDLATHGASECWGIYYNADMTGWGAGYENSCIHSGSDNDSNGDTVWYNYVLTSAGTITDKNTTSENLAVNMNTATESVCPNGWSLPSKKQIDSNRTDIFRPVSGGFYVNATLNNDSSGYWFGSEAMDSGSLRYALGYSGVSLYTTSGARRTGYYIRCVSEEKTVTDLTYMQDITPPQFTGFFICLE